MNPHDANGALLPPSTAPSYCAGQAGNSCAMNMPPAQAPAQSGTAQATMPGTAGTPSSAPAPAHGSGPAHATRAASDLFIASALNGGQQPTFWIVLGAMLAGGAAVGVVMWLWLGGPRRSSG